MARLEVHLELERQTASALIVYFIVFISLHLSIQLKRRRIQYILDMSLHSGRTGPPWRLK